MKKTFILLFILFFAWHYNTIAQTSVYTYTGAVQTYTVPPGVISLTVDARGGCGGSSYEYYAGIYYPTERDRGGYGARVVCSLAVTPGQVLNLYVGGNGDSSNIEGYYYYTSGYYDSGYGGWNGGGSGGYDSDYYYYYYYDEFGGGGGGGASDIRIGGTALTNRVIVAGGGGGGAWGCGGVDQNRGGDGGGLTGENGYRCTAYYSSDCGAGGTQSTGGAGATYYTCGTNSGTLGIGGSSDTCYAYYYYYDEGGGGGGGGYYGGGAGEYGGGGGGSSYTDSTRTTAVVHTRGYNTTLVDSIIITVNCSGGAINGVTSICTGFTTSLTDTVSGSHSWSSSNTTVATVGPTGIVTGLSAGTATITYSVMAYCGSVYSIAVVTVNPLPAAVTGITSVCLGVATALFDAATGGSWSSGSTGIATVIPSSGMTYGAGLGTSAITYTLPTGCIATSAVTVTALSTSITGTAIICGGATTALGEATTGGTWSSSSASVASVNLTSGLVTGGNVSAVGTATVTYTAPGGCTVLRVVTVDPQPAGITGAGSVCTGATASLFDGGGGTWSSSNTALATVGLATGVVTGIAPGTVTIIYTLGAGCSTSIVMAVFATPGPITGTTSLCTGATSTLADTTMGGIWTCSNTAIATIDPFAGVVYAAYGTGIATISYATGSGCAATTVVTVNLGPLPIGGTPTLCAGATTGLSDDISGGSWSSGSTGIATVDPFGNVYGVSSGTAAISYTIGACASTVVVTVNPLPALIGGVSEVCVGLATLLTDASTGGAWSSSSTAASIVRVSGILTGASAGSATITYTLPTGCFITTTETVNTTPPLITGVAHVCPGAITSLVDAGGGSWSSSNTSIATVGSTGTVGGVTPGTASIIYAIGAGCSTAVTITVNTLPPAISGITSVCVGSTTMLSDGSGTWISGTASIATIGTSSGTVTGASSGTSIITYTAAATGCTAHTVVTVNPLPSAIGGTLAVCPGATTSLNDLTSGGTWSSGNTGIATIGITGTVTGVTPGTSVITYTAPVTGCGRTAVVTVNLLPAVPSSAGPLSICAGATVILTDASSGGLWTSAPGSIATVVTASGMATGVASGTALISYTLPTGCSRAVTLTVNPVPAITGPTAECVGAVITETASLTGGAWVSSATAIATVVTGNVTGVATGTTIITYTSTAGCKATTSVTVSLSPTGIIGASSVCTNDTTTLSDAVGGGAWSSSNTAAATIGSLNGTVTGVAVGTTNITYSLGTGCTVTKMMNINAAPANITGAAGMCTGSTILLADATSGGTWSSATPGIATVTGGLVTGASAGIDTIIYTQAGCSTNTAVTINATPSAVTGTAHVCMGATTVLGDAITGGTWASSNTAIASVDPAGNLTGALPGTATITYSLGAGCAVNRMITVNPISAITGSTGICLGATTALSDAATGGTWGSGATTVASVNTAGIVAGAVAGTTVITYTTAAGCATTAVITVNLAPSVINGTLHVCAGATTGLGNTAGGGIWTSGNTAVASAGSTGIITGIVPGTSMITYSLGSGCTVTATVTVNAGAAGITGVATLCAGATAGLGDATTGGTWNSLPSSIATISGGGVVSGVAAGIAGITYTPATGCASVTTVTVNPLPSPITGTTNVCAGLTTTLLDAITGGSWNSSNTDIATADPALGIITGVTPGTAEISYTLPAGCSTSATVIINSAPPSITGSMGVCIGSVTLLSDPLGSGVWSSSNTGVATVSPTGLVSGLAIGTSTISYTLGGCPAAAVVTINSLPGALTGANLCAGATTTLTDLPDGGTWSSSDAGIATIDELAGIVTGISAGAATISYSLGAGCTVTASIMVNPVPGAITGITQVCLHYTTGLADAAGGGAWSSSNTAIATINGSGVVGGVAGGPATISYTSSGTGCTATRLVTVVAVPPITGVSDMCAFSSVMDVSDAITGGTWTSTSATVSTAGVVTPYSAGLAILTYTIPLGCYTMDSFNVHPLPGPVVGDFRFCRGLSTTLADTASGGVWSSSNTAVAPVNSEGMVTGLSEGTATVSYVLSTGCMETETITVDVTPVAGTIAGSPGVCAGATIVLIDASAGGIWSSSNTSAGVFGGIISGVSAGVDTIRYVVNNSCGIAVASATITVNPLPDAGAISGPGNVCVGANITLVDAAIAGDWTSSNTAATVIGGIVRGIAVGADTINYTVTNSCGMAITTKMLTVNTLPAPPVAISGIDTLCSGFTFLLADAVTGGSWSSSNSSLTITASGLINALSQGIDTVTYSLSNMCGTVSVSTSIVVKAVATADSISGAAQVCEGATDTLTGTPQGGVWSVTNGNATVIPTSAGAIISGVSPGADTVLYTMVSECNVAGAIFPITVLSSNQCDSKTAATVSNGRETLRVWPNPNDGLFTVLLSSNTDEPLQITITNIIGEKLKELTTLTNKATEIKLDDAVGIYFITASTVTGNYVAKVVFAK